MMIIKIKRRIYDYGMSTTGSRLKVARNNKRWSQDDLSKKCGWGGQSRIGNYENDVRQVKVTDLETISEVLEVRFEWLAIGKGSMLPSTPEYTDRDREIMEGICKLGEDKKNTLRRLLMHLLNR